MSDDAKNKVTPEHRAAIDRAWAAACIYHGIEDPDRKRTNIVNDELRHEVDMLTTLLADFGQEADARTLPGP